MPSKRKRIASPREAAALIAALPVDDRAIWATAFYAGLRRGELMALRFEEIDVAVGSRYSSMSPKAMRSRTTIMLPVTTMSLPVWDLSL